MLHDPHLTAARTFGVGHDPARRPRGRAWHADEIAAVPGPRQRLER